MAIQQVMLAYGSPSGAAAALRAEILADGPFMYLRLAETSGTNADNETGGVDGTYVNTVSLGNAALYTGGLTSYGVVNSASKCVWPFGSIPSLTNLTIGAIWRPAAVTGVRIIVSRDNDGGTTNRHFHFRTNGANLEWLKITGGIQTVSAAHGLSAGVPAFLHVTVTSGGSVKLYKNGLQIGSTGSITGVDYGSAFNDNIHVGNLDFSSVAQASDRFSEVAMYATVLSDARILAQAQAAGF